MFLTHCSDKHVASFTRQHRAPADPPSLPGFPAFIFYDPTSRLDCDPLTRPNPERLLSPLGLCPCCQGSHKSYMCISFDPFTAQDLICLHIAGYIMKLGQRPHILHKQHSRGNSNARVVSVKKTIRNQDD